MISSSLIWKKKYIYIYLHLSRSTRRKSISNSKVTSVKILSIEKGDGFLFFELDSRARVCKRRAKESGFHFDRSSVGQRTVQNGWPPHEAEDGTGDVLATS